MAYQIKKRGKVQEVLELLNEDGNIVHTINIDVDIDSMAASISDKYIALTKASQEIQNCKAGCVDSEKMEHLIESVGYAVYALYEAAFGIDNAKTIIDFYEGRMIEMNSDVTPFIIDIIIPRVRAQVQEMRKRKIEKYNRKNVLPLRR